MTLFVKFHQTHMTLLVLKRILTRMTQMLSVTVVNTTIPKRVRFISERGTITLQPEDLSAVTPSQAEGLIRSVLTSIFTVGITRLGMLILADTAMRHCQMELQ